MEATRSSKTPARWKSKPWIDDWSLWSFVSVTLAILFLWQHVAELHVSAVETLQANPVFKAWSGIALFGYLLSQWWLFLLRVRNQKFASQIALHQRMGAVAPVLFYIHSTQLGYGYLLLLSSVYFSNLVVGATSPTTTRIKSMLYRRTWLLAHISLSVITVMLAAYHAWIAFYFK